MDCGTPTFCIFSNSIDGITVFKAELQNYQYLFSFRFMITHVSIKLYWVFICSICCIHVLLWYARQICTRVI